ncbi:13407_t:CDS:2, partial [Funneliformis geosporum]
KIELDGYHKDLRSKIIIIPQDPVIVYRHVKVFLNDLISKDDGGSLDDDPDEERDSASSCASATDADDPIVRRRKTGERYHPQPVPPMFEI